MARSDVASDLLEWEVIWMTGLAFGAIVYGSLITIGIQCLLATSKILRERDGKRFSMHRIFQVHVTLILVMNTFLQLWKIRSYMREIVFTDPSRFTYFLHDWTNIFVVLVVALTDGLLVWRCYMVQKALFQNRPAGFHNVCWIVPLVIYISSLPVGVASVALLGPDTPIEVKGPPGFFHKGVTLFLVAVSMNITINIFATCNIIVRLLLHRRTVIFAFGKSCVLAEYPLRISGILLESAAINVPVAVFALLGTALKVNYVSVVMDMVVPGQSVASVLVTYQVVRGRAISANARGPDSREIFGASEVRTA